MHILGYFTGSEDYYNHSRCSNMPDQPCYCGYDLRNNEQADLTKTGDYSTHLFTEKSVDIIQNHNQQQVYYINGVWLRCGDACFIDYRATPVYNVLAANSQNENDDELGGSGVLTY